MLTMVLFIVFLIVFWNLSIGALRLAGRVLGFFIGLGLFLFLGLAAAALIGIAALPVALLVHAASCAIGGRGM